MRQLKWRDNLSVGVDEIDDQHKQLLRIINQLVVQIETNASTSETQKTFKQAFDYAQLHFRTEEKIMERFGYPELEAHRSIHEEFTFKLLEFDENGDINDQSFKTELLRFLRHWYLSHIISEDHKYASFISEKMEAKVNSNQ